MSGAPIDGLGLPLPEGERRPVAPPAPLACFTQPLHLAEGSGGVGFGMTGRRSTALSCAIRLAAERAVARLRLEQGVSYSVGTDYLPLDAVPVHAIVSADSLDEHAAKAIEGLLGVLDELAAGGAREDELERDRRKLLDAIAEPDWRHAQLDRAASYDLYGWEFLSAAELLAEHRALTPAAVGEALSEALATRLVVTPEGVPPPPGHAPHEGAPEQPVSGRELVPLRRKGYRRGDLVAGSRGVEHGAREVDEPVVREGGVPERVEREVLDQVRDPEAAERLVRRAGAEHQRGPERSGQLGPVDRHAVDLGSRRRVRQSMIHVTARYPALTGGNRAQAATRWPY